MRAIQLQRYGRPDMACACVEVPEPEAPGAGEVLVAMRTAAINPADLLIFEGRYPGPEIPALVGIEGAGIVEAVGPDVSGLAVGDHVMSLARANWLERQKAPAAMFLKLPKELDWGDAAQLKANPPTAMMLLADYQELEPGDWVVQNAANSAVGRHLIRLAKKRGIRTANIVRRAELVAPLMAHGADLVVVEGAETAAEIKGKVGADARVRLGIDAIGGAATRTLADVLSDGGTVVNYGFLSGEPCQITPTHLVVHQLTLTGFWLAGYMRSAARADLDALYGEVAQAFLDGTLEAPVEARYGLNEISEALAHAHREGRNGKVLLEMGR